MKKTLIAILSSLFCAIPLSGQNSGEYDVFIPIAKYIRQGDADKLSAWFASNLEIAVFSPANDVSCNQAKQIMKNFFDTYSPRSFTIDHMAGQGNMKYALGSLNAGGGMYRVTIFVSRKNRSYFIQQLKIEKNQ